MMFRSETIEFTDGRPGTIDSGRSDVTPNVSKGLVIEAEVSDDGSTYAWIRSAHDERNGRTSEPVMFIEGIAALDHIVSKLTKAARDDILTQIEMVEVPNNWKAELPEGALSAYYSEARFRTDDEIEEGAVPAWGFSVARSKEVVSLTAYAPKPQNQNLAGEVITGITGPMNRSVADRILMEFDKIRTAVYDAIEEIEIRPSPTVSVAAAPAP